MPNQTLDVMLELERRGQLPEDKKAILDELRRRGAVPGGTPGPLGAIRAGRFMGYPSTGYSYSSPEDQVAASRTAVKGLARAPLSFAEGAGALMTEALNPMVERTKGATVAEDARSRYYNAVDESRAKAEQDAPGSVLVSDIAAGALPAAPVKIAGTAVGTLRGAVGRAALEGAVASQVPYQKPEDRAMNAGLGAVVPPAVAAVAKFPGAVWNTLARASLRRADPATQQLRAQAQAAFTNPETGAPLQGADDYIAAQATGDPRLARLTTSASDIKARDVIRAQLEKRVANVREVANSLGGGRAIASDEAKARAFFGIVDRAHLDMKTARNTQYQTAMDALAASPEGRAVRIPIKPVLDELRAIQAEFGNPLALAKDTTGGTRIAEAIEFLESLPPGSPAFTINGFKKLVTGINAGRVYGLAAQSDPRQATLEVIRNRLRKAAQAAADSAPANDVGVNKFKQIQQDYAAQSDRIRRLEDDVVVDLFGDKKVLADPDSAFDRFIKASPSAQKLGVGILGTREGGPELLRYMQRRYLDSVLDRATGGATPASQSTLNPKVLLEGLTDPRIQRSPLFTPEQKKWMAGAGADLRVVLNSLPDTARVGTDLTPADITANVVGMNPVFVSRLMARVVTGVGLENVLFTQEGRRALSTLRNLEDATDASRNAAIGYLLGLVGSESLSQPPPN